MRWRCGVTGSCVHGHAKYRRLYLPIQSTFNVNLYNLFVRTARSDGGYNQLITFPRGIHLLLWVNTRTICTRSLSRDELLMKLHGDNIETIWDMCTQYMSMHTLDIPLAESLTLRISKLNDSEFSSEKSIQAIRTILSLLQRDGIVPSTQTIEHSMVTARRNQSSSLALDVWNLMKTYKIRMSPASIRTFFHALSLSESVQVCVDVIRNISAANSGILHIALPAALRWMRRKRSSMDFIDTIHDIIIDRDECMNIEIASLFALAAAHANPPDAIRLLEYWDKCWQLYIAHPDGSSHHQHTDQILTALVSVTACLCKANHPLETVEIMENLSQVLYDKDCLLPETQLSTYLSIRRSVSLHLLRAKHPSAVDFTLASVALISELTTTQSFDKMFPKNQPFVLKSLTSCLLNKVDSESVRTITDLIFQHSNTVGSSGLNNAMRVLHMKNDSSFLYDYLEKVRTTHSRLIDTSMMIFALRVSIERKDITMGQKWFESGQQVVDQLPETIVLNFLKLIATDPNSCILNQLSHIVEQSQSLAVHLTYLTLTLKCGMHQPKNVKHTLDRVLLSGLHGKRFPIQEASDALIQELCRHQAPDIAGQVCQRLQDASIKLWTVTQRRVKLYFRHNKPF